MSDFTSGLLVERDGPAWLQARREAGLARWLAAEKPTRKTEAWKYTSLQLLERDFNIPPLPELLAEVGQIARNFQQAGVSALHVSVGFGASIKDPNFIPSITPMRTPDNCIVHLAENIKKVVSIPVIAVNKIKDVIRILNKCLLTLQNYSRIIF